MALLSRVQQVDVIRPRGIGAHGVLGQAEYRVEGVFETLEVADEWIRKLWYIYTMEYYSATRKNAFESVLMKWMKLEPIIQTEVSQKKKIPIQYNNTYMWNLER